MRYWPMVIRCVTCTAGSSIIWTYTDPLTLLEYSINLLTRIQTLTRNCFIGSKVFLVLRDLQKHICNSHSENPKPKKKAERTHFCTLCGRGFTNSWNLQIHMKRHNNEKPYQCDQCAKAYTLKETNIIIIVFVLPGNRIQSDPNSPLLVGFCIWLKIYTPVTSFDWSEIRPIFQRIWP